MIGLEIRHGGVMRVCAIENKTAVVVASYCSVSINRVRFKSLHGTLGRIMAKVAEKTVKIN